MIREDKLSTTGLPCYTLSDDALEYGASLGNAHCWLNTRGKGAIQQFFSTDIGKAVVGNVSIAYGGAGHRLLGVEEEGASPIPGETDVQLRPATGGTIEVHPAYQRRLFRLPEHLRVEETVFVPLTSDDDPALAYYTTEISNDGSSSRRVEVFAFARLGATFSAEMDGRFDPYRRALIATDTQAPANVRVFGSTDTITACETTRDFGRVYDVYHVHRLEDDTSAKGDILGVLQVSLYLEPGQARRITFVLAFSHEGEDAALHTYDEAGDAQDALNRTIEYLTGITSIAQVMTPDAVINRGVMWSKINMLRVRARYPGGVAFTNDPGASSNVVARDAAWFVYGSDHFMPEMSRVLLDTFARLQYESGKIPEYYNGDTGFVDDYGLNINDDTPLFVLAVNHHFRATGDLEWLRGIYPAVAKAARYIATQRDARGLVHCTSDDRRGSLYAICGWRNIIPDYSISGAVTEVNAECVAALRAAGHLTENLGLPAAERQEFFDHSDAIRQAMNTHLINPSNGMYLLAIDTNGVARTDITADEVFPVMFRACPDDVGFRIIRRLNHPDFWTAAGLRTVSSDDPLYEPGKNYGLLGGVWPGMTWWYAFAAARYHPELMVQALRASFTHYAADPKKNTTVPGQFGEWFDGESLVNRGMRLSPWEPPRFLWAAIEGVCGAILQPGKLKVQPLVPVSWRWVGMRRLSYHGRQISFFATREEPGKTFSIFACGDVVSEHDLEVFDEDVSDSVRVLDSAICHLALRRPGQVALLLGNTGATTSIVAVEMVGVLAGATTAVRFYDSEARRWRTGALTPELPGRGFSVTIEAGGYRLIIFDEHHRAARVEATQSL